MTPTTPSVSTLAIRDSITEAYESYKDSKTKFPLPVVLTMLAAVAGTCVRVFTLFIYILITVNEHSNRNSSLTVETLRSTRTPASLRPYSSFVKNTTLSTTLTRASPTLLASRTSGSSAERSSSSVTMQTLKSAVLQTLLLLLLRSNPRSVSSLSLFVYFLKLLAFLSFYSYTAIQAQRGRKTIKSKAIIDDKDDDDVEIVGDVDVTMGASDGPITAASGSDAVRIDSFSRFLLIIQSLICTDDY